MPENNFEKKVAAELGDLQFRPSEEVWPKVEERIRKKKKRRGFIIFFLFAGLALFGWWQRHYHFGNENNNLTETRSELNTKKKTSSDIDLLKNSNKNEITVKESQSEITKTNDGIEKKVIEKDEVEKNEQKTNFEKNTVSKLTTAETSIKPNIKNNATQVASNPGVKTVVKSEKQHRDKIQDENNIAFENKDKLSVEKTDDKVVLPAKKEDELAVAVLPADSFLLETKKETDSLNKQVDIDSVSDITTDTILNKPKKGFVKKWKWGIQFTPGISSLNDQLLSLNLNKSAELYGVPQGGIGGGANPSPAPPVKAKAGFAFQIGFFATRELSAKSSLSLGLQYGQYTNRFSLGNRRDSLLNNFNLVASDGGPVYGLSGTRKQYINRHHFIELPVIFHWQLNKNNDKPFVWSNGITLGQLISTNALMYDTSFSGIYYSNKDLLNKFQVSVTSSFMWTLAGKQKIKMSFGPVADLHINGLLNNPFEGKKYLFFTGIKSRIVFNRKK